MRRVTSRDVWLLLTAEVLLAITRLALSVFSFQVVLQVLNRLSVVSRDGHLPTADAIERVKWAVGRASRCVPGARHCLTQALAAQFLLARQGRSTQLRIGVAKDEAGQLRAHAWLESDGVAIFGVPHSGLQEYRLLPHLDRA